MKRARVVLPASAHEAIARLVAEAPPLKPAQRDRIAVLMRGGEPKTVDVAALEKARRESEAASRVAEQKRFAESLTACDVCDVPLAKHHFPARTADWHDWVSGRAERLMGARGGVR